jgi:RNA polymerase sigma factor (sigma-70 family)
MQEKPDAQLLRAYLEGDEAAFREIVSRHTDLIYSAALRQVSSPDLAQDIAQSVFVDLVRKAKQISDRLTPKASLAGWLYRSTRFAVLTRLRDDQRRARHERQAMEQLITDSSPATDWERIRPHLDEAVAELSDDDRDALLLRYFKNHDFQTVGRALGLSDDAAQKRVSRAVERLREFFSKRGVTIGAGALLILISANAVQSAPLALATTISTGALLSGTTAHAPTAIAATKIIAMTALQKTAVTVTLAAAIATGVFKAHQVSQLRAQVQTLEREKSSLTAQLQQLQEQQNGMNSTVSSLRDENERLKSNMIELAQLRSEIAQFRNGNQDLALARHTNQPAANNLQSSDSAANIRLPKNSWTNAGFATPEDNLRTRGWAVLNGDRERFKESVFLTDGARKLIEDMIMKMGAASTDADKVAVLQDAVNNSWGAEEAILMPLMALNKDKGFTGYDILSEQSPSDDEKILEVETQMASAPPQKEILNFRRFGNDWKVVIDENFVKSAH